MRNLENQHKKKKKKKKKKKNIYKKQKPKTEHTHKHPSSSDLRDKSWKQNAIGLAGTQGPGEGGVNTN